ncbi:MAG: SulP family inorganic anion transporter [Acidimicrobiia bacterium]
MPELTGVLDRPRSGWDLIRHYERGWLTADVLAGFTVAALLVPQCMAYAEVAGVPPATGFHAALLALVAYAVIGTSRHLGVGPEPGTAILAAAGVSGLVGADQDPARYLTLMSALALTVAAVCFVAYVLRLGFLADLLSKPVLVGYITGVGLTLISSQISKFTAVRITTDTFFPRAWELVRNIDEIDGLTLGLGAASLAGILALRRWYPRLPASLIVVALAGLVVALMSLDDHGISEIGAIPSGIPSLRIPDVALADLGSLLPIAFGIALVGYSDNVITARSVAARLGYRIDPNRELLALGVENLASGVSRGFPISSSASRTGIAADLRSRTQLTGVIAAATLALALVTMRPLLERIPTPALAAVILAAGIAILDVPGYRDLWRVSRAEFGLAVIAALGVMIFDVLVGVLIAVVLSAVVALYRMARPHDAVLGAAAGQEGWVDVDEVPGATTLPGLLVYRFDAPLFFANTTRFDERLHAVLDANPGTERWVVLDFEGVGSVDATATDALFEILASLRSAGVATVAIARANDHVLDRLGRARLLPPDGTLRTFLTINAAVRAFEEDSRPPPISGNGAT